MSFSLTYKCNVNFPFSRYLRFQHLYLFDQYHPWESRYEYYVGKCLCFSKNIIFNSKTINEKIINVCHIILRAIGLWIVHRNKYLHFALRIILRTKTFMATTFLFSFLAGIYLERILTFRSLPIYKKFKRFSIIIQHPESVSVITKLIKYNTIPKCPCDTASCLASYSFAVQFASIFYTSYWIIA